jgi:hypothetical protein
MAGTGKDGGGGWFDLNTSFSDLNVGLFGEDKEQSGTGTVDETVTEQLQIDEAAILKLIGDVLGGTEGLAEIFGTEAAAGVFGGSPAKQGTEDLLAKIAGELAKVTGKKVATKKGTTTTEQKAESEGLVDQLFKPFKKLF